MFNIPPNDEIKRRYSISNSDFEAKVVTKLPSPKELKSEECFLEKVADFFGAPTFLKRTKALVVVAVLFLPYWGPKALHEVQDAAIISYEYWLGPFQNLPARSDVSPRYVFALPPESTSGPTGPIDLRTGQFPSGAIITSGSGILDEKA